MDARGAVKLKPGETVQGYIPAVDFVGQDLTPTPTKLIHWTESAYIGPHNEENPRVFGNEGVPQHVFEDMQAGLPAPVRRTARQRNEVLIQRLLDIGKSCPVIAGRIMWPDSLQRVLDTTGTKNNGDLYPQVFALARVFSLKAENKQKENDGKTVARGWHGHYD